MCVPHPWMRTCDRSFCFAGRPWQEQGVASKTHQTEGDFLGVKPLFSFFHHVQNTRVIPFLRGGSFLDFQKIQKESNHSGVQGSGKLICMCGNNKWPRACSTSYTGNGDSNLFLSVVYMHTHQTHTNLKHITRFRLTTGAATTQAVVRCTQSTGTSLSRHVHTQKVLAYGRNKRF